MKKRISMFLTIVVFALMLNGCGSTVPESFSEDEVKEKVQELIELTFADDFEAINAQSAEVLASQITAEQLRSGLAPYLEKAGNFQEISKIVVAGNEDKNGDEFVTSMAVVKCSKGELTFTISLDKEMQVSGYYLK